MNYDYLHIQNIYKLTEKIHYKVMKLSEVLEEVNEKKDYVPSLELTLVATKEDFKPMLSIPKYNNRFSKEIVDGSQGQEVEVNFFYRKKILRGMLSCGSISEDNGYFINRNSLLDIAYVHESEQVLRVKDAKFSPVVIQYLLNYDAFTYKQIMREHTKGFNFLKIDLDKITIRVPVGKDMLKAECAILAINNSIEYERKLVDKLKKIKKALLEKMFV